MAVWELVGMTERVYVRSVREYNLRRFLAYLRDFQHFFAKSAPTSSQNCIKIVFSRNLNFDDFEHVPGGVHHISFGALLAPMPILGAIW